MIGTIYAIQILTSLLIYKVHMTRLKTFNINYKNTIYFKIFAVLLGVYFILSLIFKLSIVSVPSSVVVYFAYKYLNKYFKNTIMSNNDYIYIGVGVLRKDCVEDAFIEHGSNLEKKYNVTYKGFEKYKSSDYIVLRTNNSNYVLVKNYDVEYYNTLKTFFNIRNI